MKNTVKRIMALAMAAIMLLAFTGCSPEKKAEKAVTSFLTALKNVEIEEAGKYINTDASTESDFASGENKIFAEKIFGKMEYEILSSEAVNDAEVKVSLKITNVDMKPVLGEFMMQALQYAFSNMAADPAPTEEEMEAKYMEILTECLSKDDLATVTNEVEVTVVDVNGEWKINVEETFANAMLGGLSDAAKELQNSFGG